MRIVGWSPSTVSPAAEAPTDESIVMVSIIG